MGVFDSSMQLKVHNHPLLNAILMKHFSICMLVSSKSILLLLIKEMRLPPDFPIAIQCWHTKNYFILFYFIFQNILNMNMESRRWAE